MIPRIHVNVSLLDNSTEETLKRGPARVTGSGELGQTGNVVSDCHRTVYGSPCFNVDRLTKGDQVSIQFDRKTKTLSSYSYIVESVSVMKSGRASLFDTADPSALANTTKDSLLTIVTQHPLYSTRERLVVRARFVAIVEYVPAG